MPDRRHHQGRHREETLPQQRTQPLRKPCRNAKGQGVNSVKDRSTTEYFVFHILFFATIYKLKIVWSRIKPLKENISEVSCYLVLKHYGLPFIIESVVECQGVDEG